MGSGYHKRSNVESTFNMVTREFGDSVRWRTDTAMTNEVLCSRIADKLCVLTHEEFELGIQSEFRPTTQQSAMLTV